MNQAANEYLLACHAESILIKNDFVLRYQQTMLTIAEIMAHTFMNGKKIIVMGNGGSASDALHFAGELTGRLMEERQALPCITIGSGMASLTAIANDYTYDLAFKREMQAYAVKGDLVFAISTSGKSKNVCHAAKYARDIGCFTVGLTGHHGGLLTKIVDCDLNVSMAHNSARTQEVHIWIIHMLIDLMDRFYLKTGEVPKQSFRPKAEQA